MPSYDFTVQEHRIDLDYAWEGSHYVVRCSCGWEYPSPRARHIAQTIGERHVAERERAMEAAREKTRYLIHEEP